MRRRRFTWLGIAAASGVAAAVALAMAFTGAGPSSTNTRTALAGAPEGNYAVVTRPLSETTDALYAVSATDATDAFYLAAVDHLPGYRLAGAVSPSGTHVALLVPDAGTLASPTATLHVVSIETGESTALTRELDPLQEPVWSPDGRAVYVMRRSNSEASAGMVSLWAISVDGSLQTEAVSPRPAFGIYPVGTSPDGALVAVQLDDAGSTLITGGQAGVVFAPGFTRDWRLSPDGTTLAYIETVTEGGLHYEARLVRLDGSGVTASTQTGDSSRNALGTAWAPDGEATFGYEPAAGGASAQTVAAGFDLPLAYSGDGAVLAVEHYDGASFEAPGTRSLEVVSAGGRLALDGYTAFLGWIAR